MNEKTAKAALAAAAEALASAAQAFEALSHLAGRKECAASDRGLLLSVPEAAEALGMSTSWVYKAVECGELPHVRLGAKVKLRRADLDEYIAAQLLG